MSKKGLASKIAYVELCGGLGNQLLQLISVESMRVEGIKTYIGLHWFSTNKFDTERSISVDLTKYNTISNRVISKILRLSINEKKFSLKEVLSAGWYEAFECVMKSQNLWTSTTSNERIVAHVRLGDYLDTKYKERYLITNDKYYLDAYDSITCNGGEFELWVVTDSPDRLKEYYPNLERKAKKIICQDQISDFNLMASSKYFISSNSTFSMLAALVEFEDKHVFFPEKWLDFEEFSLDNFKHRNIKWR